MLGQSKFYRASYGPSKCRGGYEQDFTILDVLTQAGRSRSVVLKASMIVGKGSIDR